MKFVLFFFSTIIICNSTNIDKEHHESLIRAWELVVTNDCILPSFITILPVFYLRRIKKIWTLSKNDKLEDCKSIWKESKKFVYQLPRVLQNRFIDHVGKEESDKMNANFIFELLPEERAYFDKTLRNVSISAIEKAEILSVWGNERLSTSALSNFNKFLESLIKREERMKVKINNLSSEAKKAYKQIIELRKIKQNLFASFSNDVKKELMNLWKQDIIVRRKSTEGENDFLSLDEMVTF
uniref:Uncharacterized protein n=1 Tax=Parastrongyloides trichosuri TaxID=131310 RepID=A0A0N4ZVF8_PARTI